MLSRQSPPRLLLINICTLGNADQRIMRLVHLGLGKIDVIRGNQRQTHGIGHLYKAALGHALRFGLPILAGMTLQLDIEPVTERRCQPVHQRLRGRTLTFP